MLSRPKYLTKSRFKLACACPAKLYYTEKELYPNTNAEDPFMKALAEGGYQVGELAKCYFEGGQLISTLSYDESLALTKELLKKKNVTIFEAAIRFKDLFVRIDILVKKGNQIELIEVKAKSVSVEDKNGDGEYFLTKNGKIDSGWTEYLYDVAFQKFVLSKAYPDYIRCFPKFC